MSVCDRCNSERILSVTGKVWNLCSGEFEGKNFEGYAPYGVHLGGGDYLEFDLCLECGKIQGEFPAIMEEL